MVNLMQVARSKNAWFLIESHYRVNLVVLYNSGEKSKSCYLVVMVSPIVHGRAALYRCGSLFEPWCVHKL